MPGRDEFDLARARRLAVRPDTAVRPSSGSAAFVGTVTTTAAAGNYMAVTPLSVTGTESEGGTPVLTAGSGSVLVYNIGPATPTVGENLVCRMVDYRWVAERRGPSEPATPCSGAVVCTVRGCNSLNLAGATVTATRTGFITRTATTNSSGGASLSLPQGAWTVVVSRSRFNSATRTVTVASGCGVQFQTFTLSAATGYSCVTGCAVPLSNTLHATSPVGSVTLTNTTGTWVGSIGFGGRSCIVPSGPPTPCTGTAGTDTVSLTFVLSGGGTGAFLSVGTQGSVSAGVRNPNGDTWTAAGCTSPGISNGTGGFVSCPESYLFSGSIDGAAWTDGNGNVGTSGNADIYFGGAVTITE